MSKEMTEQYGFGNMDSNELDKQIAYWMGVKRGLKREGIECAWGRKQVAEPSSTGGGGYVFHIGGRDHEEKVDDCVDPIERHPTLLSMDN